MIASARPFILSSVVAAALSACAPVDTGASEALGGSGELVALSGGGAGARNACFTCHGIDGRGNGAGAPRLAGLDAGYLERQLIAYADGRRRHSGMAWIARHLDTKETRLVSAYYAAMPPGDGGEVPSAHAGMTPPALWLAGDPGRGIASCASCHGADGLGKGSAIPPLAGQPAAYQQHQIDQWRRGQRRTDPGDVMLRISQRLTPFEAEALSRYAASLGAASRGPERPEASR